MLNNVDIGEATPARVEEHSEVHESGERDSSPIPGPCLVNFACQKRTGSRRAKAAVVFADALAIAAAMVLAAWIRWALSDTPVAISPLWLVSLCAIPIWLGIFARYKLYSAAAVTSVTAEVSRIVHGVAAAAICTGFLATLLNASISRVWLVLTFALALVAVIVERAIVRRTFRRARSRGKLRRRVIVVGTNAEAVSLAEMLEANSQLGYQVIGLLAHEASGPIVAPVPVLGTWRDVNLFMQEFDANGVIIATSAIDIALTNKLAREVMELGYHVELTSGLVDISANRLITKPLGRRPVMHIEPVRRAGWRALAKRGFDIVCAAGLLCVSAPVLLASAICIKLTSHGPVLFLQERVGRNGELFTVRKFRTMVAGADRMLNELQDRNDADGPLFKMRDDPRVTRVGAFLRKWSIDELPQLWNVLVGDMSIVGPRPALSSEAVYWSEELRNRLRVRPGITGMWQVNGRSSSLFSEYERQDLYYVDNWSLLTDLAIVAKTIPAVLLHRGAY